MSSEMSANDMEMVIPSTPQPQHASLPDITEHPPPLASPSTSMLVGDSSSSPIPPYLSDLPDTQSQGLDRLKYNSPPAPSPSMTPPPSSQVTQRPMASSMPERAVTPVLSQISSPPPTEPQYMKKESGAPPTVTKLSTQEINEASIAELREMLQTSIVENSRLDADLREARLSAAHYKLQHNLLSIETEEASKRMIVENEMTRREVEVLQMAEHSRQSHRELSSPAQAASGRHLMELKAHCQALDEEISLLHRRLSKSKKLLSQKNDIITSVEEENLRLRQRIRENRDHVTRLKSPGGLFAAAATTPRSAHTHAGNFPPLTPQQFRATPKLQQTPGSGRSHYRHQNQHQYPQQHPHQHHHHHHHDNERDGGGSSPQEPFAALLLADRVLSQENNGINSNNNNPTSAPSTPHGGPHGAPRRIAHTLGHTRAAQSLSSLPTTPVRARPMTSSSNGGGSGERGGLLLPSIQLAPFSEPRYRGSQQAAATAAHHEHQQPPHPHQPHRGYQGYQQQQQQQQARERRRKSRDSTISASDHEDSGAEDAHRGRHGGSRGAAHAGRDGDAGGADVGESQASASAAAMLRRDPRESFEIRRGTPTPSQLAEKALYQARMFGTVGKPGMGGLATAAAAAEKRKRADVDADVDDGREQGRGGATLGKRARTGEGVGLGIKTFASPRA